MSAQITAVGTTTTVDIDLVDSRGARWAGAKVQVTFVAPPNTPAPWLFDGASFQQYYFFENIGPSGHFTIDLPSNLDIIPRGNESFWRFDIAPNMDDGRSVPITVQLSTSAQDLTSAFEFATEQLLQFPVQSIPVPRASGDFDVIITPNDGQLYFDVTMQELKVWSNGGWQVVSTGGGGGGGGISYPPPGIPVSQGTAWGVSIDPATLVTQSQLTANYLPLAGGTLTGQLNFGDAGAFIQRSAQYEVIFGSPARLYFYNGYGAGYTMVTGWNNPGSIGGPDQASNCTIALTPLYLSSDPTSPPQAVTKRYVDNNFFPITGGSITGGLVLSGAPGTAGLLSPQINDSFYVVSNTDNGFHLIQDAINYVFQPGAVDGVATIFVNKWYSGTEDITTLTGDPSFSPRTTIVDQRTAPWTFYSFNGTNWVAQSYGGGGGATYPPAGIPVSTGSAWGTSLDPDNSYLKLTGGTVTGNIIMTGAGGTGLWMQAGVNIFLGDPYNYFQGLGGSSCMFKMNNNFYIQPWNSGTSIFSINYSASLGWYTAQLTAPTTINSNFTVIGVTTLSADPVNPLEAATKQYVDNNYLPLAGGIVTGNLGVNGYLTVGTTLSVSGAAAFNSSVNANSLTVVTNANIQGDISCVNLGASGQVKALAAPSFVSIPRTAGMVSLTNNPTGLVMVNPNAAADQKFSYIQITNSSSSGTIHFGFQNDAATAGHDYFTIIPSGAQASQIQITSPWTTIGSGAPLVIFDRSVIPLAGYPTTPNINSDASNLFLQAAQSGGVFFNWDKPANCNFGNGSTSAPAIIAQIASDGGIRSAFKFEVGEIGTITNNAHHMASSYDMNGNQGIIQSLQEGVGYTQTHIQPNGGNVMMCNGTLGVFFSSHVDCWVDFNVNGGHNLTVSGSKNFRIQHPTIPDKDLIHACLEGPENGVYYRGEAVTDDYGEIEISLPEYFEALTRPYGRTVILTAVFDEDEEDFGQVACSVVMAGKFKVRSQYAEQRFFWEVKAVRSDIEPLVVTKDKLERVH